MRAEIFFKNNSGLSMEDFFNQAPATKTIHCAKHGAYLAKKHCKWLGNVKYTDCPKCQEERLKAEADLALKEDQEIERIKNELFLRKLQNRGVNAVYLKKRLEGISDIGVSKDLKNLTRLNANNNGFENDFNLLILGGTGIGKSFFAYQMVEIATRIGIDAICIKGLKLESLYRKSNTEDGKARFNSYENLEAFIKDYQILIVDEIDDIQNQDVLKHAVSICYDEGVRLILIANYNKDEFVKHIDEKTRSRLRGFKFFIFGNDKKDLRG